MATDKKISDLAVATTPSGAELVEIVQGGVNKQTTLQQIADLASGGVSSVNGETGAVTLNAADVGADASGSAAAAQAAAIAAGVSATVGVQDLFIPASAFWPRVTSGCSPLAQTEFATSLINAQTLDFNQTTQQYAQVMFLFPRKYNLGTITYQVVWTATTGTGSVVWSVQGVALADGDLFTTAFGTAVNVTDAAGTANTRRLTTTSGAVTLGNTPADADGIYLQVSRVTGDASDDMAADAKFIGLWIHVTTDAAIDA